MNLKNLFIAGVFILCAPIANAQMMVVGGGLAKDCYTAALSNTKSPSAGERVCSNALQQETLTTDNRAATYANRGIFKMRGGHYSGAIADFGTAKRMRPELGATYLNEGAAQIYAGNFSEALNVLNKAIELKTQDLHSAHYNRAIAKEYLGDVSGAYYDFKKALELRPDWDLPRNQLSRFSVTQG